MKRYLSLDLGDRTIGVAVSDVMGWTAQGIETIRRKALSDDLHRLGELFAAYDISAVVAGLPKNMNGSEGERCEIVYAFMDEIKKAYPQMEIFYQDERLTTVTAERTLKEASVSRKKRKSVVDKMAAVIILQTFLDGGHSRAERMRG